MGAQFFNIEKDDAYKPLKNSVVAWAPQFFTTLRTVEDPQMKNRAGLEAASFFTALNLAAYTPLENCLAASGSGA